MHSMRIFFKQILYYEIHMCTFVRRQAGGGKMRGKRGGRRKFLKY